MAETVQDVSEADKRHLVELVKELRRSNAVLRAETDMYEWYISRLDPRDLVPQPLSDSLGAAAASHYQATLEEADIRLVEVKKASYEFDRDVAKVLREKRGVMMGAEKVIRYFEDRMRAKDTLVEKLRLKNAALHVQKRKLQLQLRQKEEMGEALHEVDFQQLKIENSQYLERIDERNQDLLRLKLLAGNTLQVLNSYKKKLQSMTCESKLLSSDITSRKEMLVKIEEETLQAEEERAKAETLNRKLRGQLADFRVPHVLQYITAKASHSQLEQSVRAWERKVEISEMALKTHTKTWNKLKEAAGVGPVTAR
ncbi:coiled-coil domain-containing protein 113 [Salvelinus namaycush]|uniref:Cilia- and flagella-associated protein 263 n=1 Tax=Salvelinus namaycush TaxID=8040 RepID=A0A8U1BXL8_SALNM|nr:coiled-coil domain-containing protein 113 [Salvelinus namaycush]